MIRRSSSRCARDNLQGYMTVSEVGRIAMGSSSSDVPLQMISVGAKAATQADVRSCDPCNFRRETFYVVLFPLEDLGGNKQREVRVLNAHRLDLAVEPLWMDVRAISKRKDILSNLG